MSSYPVGCTIHVMHLVLYNIYEKFYKYKTIVLCMGMFHVLKRYILLVYCKVTEDLIWASMLVIK